MTKKKSKKVQKTKIVCIFAIATLSQNDFEHGT